MCDKMSRMNGQADGKDAEFVDEARTLAGMDDCNRLQSYAVDCSRRMLGRCLNGLCDDWECAESVCAGLGIGPEDAAGGGAVRDCLRRAVAEGLAEAFDFREGSGFVRHDGGLENMEKLWFFITERGRAALEEMPEEWFAGTGAEGDGTSGTDGTNGTGMGRG